MPAWRSRVADFAVATAERSLAQRGVSRGSRNAARLAFADALGQFRKPGAEVVIGALRGMRFADGDDGE